MVGRSDGGGTWVPRKARDSFTGLQTSSGKEFSLTREVSDAAFITLVSSAPSAQGPVHTLKVQVTGANHVSAPQAYIAPTEKKAN